MSEGVAAELAVRRGGFSVDVELAVRPGEVVALLGPNGAGKSTVLSMLAGLLAPERGRISVAGRKLLDTERGIAVPPHRRGVGLLAQQALLFPQLSVLDNVAFGPRSAGCSRAQSRQRARHWLSTVEAEELAERAPRQLSGGQAQRVAIARALAAEPALLLLDEPLAALDVDTAPVVRALLGRVLAESRKPAVLVTHDVLDAVVLADTLVVVADGRVHERGPTREVLAQPRAAFTASIAGLNLISGSVTGDAIDGAGTTIHGVPSEPLPKAGSAVAVFEPNSVAVHPRPPGGSPRNAVGVRVLGMEPQAGRIRVRGAAEDLVLAADITPAAVADLRLSVGDEVWFVVKATEVALHPVSGGSSGP